MENETRFLSKDFSIAHAKTLCDTGLIHYFLLNYFGRKRLLGKENSNCCALELPSYSVIF